MAEGDTLNPRQVVDLWLDSAHAVGQLDTYEAKRRDARCSWRQPMELRIGDEINYVQCRDISAGGIGLTSKCVLERDQEVHIRRGEHEPWIRCHVTHVTRTIGAFKVGVELVFDFD